MSAILSIDQNPPRRRVNRHGVADIEQQGGLQHTSEELSESGSLADFNRMAQFVAHDFRHHLCAVYSNAEFMCNTSYVQSEREEMFEEIRTTILCMTETLDSVLLHARTGCTFHLRPEPLKLIVERAVQIVRSHPDADKVNLIYDAMPLVEVRADSRWLCSAIFNLLLNACQAVQLSSDLKEVRVWCWKDQTTFLFALLTMDLESRRRFRRVSFSPL
jgi:C4-dicarboxylate-specific signal transduction histidine kinase